MWPAGSRPRASSMYPEARVHRARSPSEVLESLVLQIIGSTTIGRRGPHEVQTGADWLASREIPEQRVSYQGLKDSRTKDSRTKNEKMILRRSGRRCTLRATSDAACGIVVLS